MFESLSLLSLQQYWWIIVSLLGALLVFLMFVQGGQTLIYTLGKTGEERTLLVNLLGRKWELTFTTLVTFGGAFFASFPLFYSTSFGGAYWVWMLILLAFVIQAVSYEYRKKPGNLFGSRLFEVFLFLNGLLGTLLIGTAVATFFTGSTFSVDKMNLLDLNNGMPVISEWKGPAHGLEAVLDVRNLLLGFSVFFLARTLGLLYFLNRIDHPSITGRIRKHLFFNAVSFLLLFIAFLASILLSKGFAVDPGSGRVYMEPYKYWHNLIQMPLVAVMLIAGIAGVGWGLLCPLTNRARTKGIWPAGAGTILTVWALFLTSGLNNTAYYPSTFDLQSSLTIGNSSSSHYTLTVMSYVSLLIPLVAGYIAYVWYAMDKKKISTAELESEKHLY
ncbi:MAG TPA: cytochrome d ubiquinol oxidase subunit II [Bacteroidales bacterium]|nr:cytochrome d ubiquinol oxidase subunit II [Bacteroidales bacterium]